MSYVHLEFVIYHTLKAGLRTLDIDDSLISELPADGMINMACLTAGLPQEAELYRFLDLDSCEWVERPALASAVLGKRMAIVHEAAAMLYDNDATKLADTIEAALQTHGEKF